MHRIADRRAVFQANHPPARRAEFGVFIQQPAQFQQQRLTILQTLAGNHELAEIFGLELLIQRQIKARRALADIGHVVVDMLFLRVEVLLQPRRFALAGGNRRAFRQAQVHNQLQPRGIREKLLLHPLTKQRQRADKDQYGQHQHLERMADAQRDQATEPGVKAFRQRVQKGAYAPARLFVLPIGQKVIAQIRNDDHRREP